jgi:PAS domain-containing protein
MIDSYRFGIFSWALSASTLASAGLFYYLWRSHRENPAARFLALLCVSVGFWAFSNIFEHAALTYRLKLIWSQISYLGIVTAPVFYFLFSIAFVQKTRFLTKKTYTVLSIIPALTIFLAFSNEYHKLIWTDIVFQPESTLAVYGHGILYWFFSVGYSYLLLLGGFVLIWISNKHLSPFYRSQAIPIFAGLLLPFMGNIIYVFGLNPIPGLDWTPVVFSLTCLLLAWGMFRFRLFDIAPIARSLLVETMSDGILVLNERNEILDLNPAMKILLGGLEKAYLGRRVGEVFQMWPEILPHLESNELCRMESVRNFGDENLYFDVGITSFLQPTLSRAVRIFVFRDITRKKRLELEKEKLQEKLLAASTQVKTLEGLLPICAGCKKIRDDTGNWNDIETYMEGHAKIEFTHGLCPDCLKKYSKPAG